MNESVRNEIVTLLNGRRPAFQKSASAVSRFLGDKFMEFMNFDFATDTSVELEFDESKGYDYSIHGNAVAVKIVALGFNDYNSVIEGENLSRFKVIVVYDGEHAVFYAKNSDGEFKKIADINIEKATADEVDRISSLIHLQSYELDEALENIFESMKSVSDEQLINLIQSRTDEVCQVISKEFFDGGVIEAEQLRRCLSGEGSTSDSTVNAPVEAMTDEKEVGYRTQIMELTNEVAKLQEQLETVTADNKKLQDTIDNMEGVELRKAKELLNFIEDGPDKERTYVAVINTELIQNSTLSSFVGNVLQHLSALKLQDAAPFIFNGDMFQIVRDKDSRDMILNGVNYRIDLEGMSEGDVLNKLRVLFSNFSDIIFLCRTNGGATAESKSSKIPDSNSGSEYDTIKSEAEEVTDSNTELESGLQNTDEDADEISIDLDSNSDDSSYNPDSYEEESNSYEPQFSDEATGDVGQYDSYEAEQNTNYEESNYENDFDSELSGDNIDYSSEQSDNFTSFEDDSNNQGYVEDDSVEFSDGDSSFDEFSENDEDSIDLDFGDDISSDEEYTMEDDENAVYFACVPIESIIYGDNGFKELLSLDYLMVGNDVYDINASGENNDNNYLFARCIEGVLASALKNGRNSIIKEIKKLDLTTVSELFLPYTSNTALLPRVATTKYVVANVMTLTDVARGIADVCNSLNIEYTDIKLGMSVTIEDVDKTDEMWFFDKNVIDNQVSEYQSSMPLGIEPEIVPCLVRGNLYNSISVTSESLAIHENMIRNVVAIKTRAITKQIAHPKDVAEILAEFIFDGMQNGRINNVESIGTILGTSELIVSDDPSRVSNGIKMSSIDGYEIYISGDMSEQQKLYAIIRIYTMIYRDANIVVKVAIDKTALEFYKNKFNTADPIFALASQSYIEYMYNMYLVSTKK